ncbi:hypothetical protein [Nonomuraea maritima]|uniref:hypothetical protein n=1 Tax=Nonomuraea maritima TaxID=683260 RepID=UPI001FDF57FD|nr:hypothetical protein [Nonomuraea maritima]
MTVNAPGAEHLPYASWSPAACWVTWVTIHSEHGAEASHWPSRPPATLLSSARYEADSTSRQAVHAERGPVGGYRLGQGAKMPPLLLDDDERGRGRGSGARRRPGRGRLHRHRGHRRQSHPGARRAAVRKLSTDK